MKETKVIHMLRNVSKIKSTAETRPPNGQWSPFLLCPLNYLKSPAPSSSAQGSRPQGALPERWVPSSVTILGQIVTEHLGLARWSKLCVLNCFPNLNVGE
jgi:hypothetical protein